MMIKIANMMKRLKKDEKGFTLIELMVVIAVLGILAALIIPQFSNVSTKAQLSNAQSTASAVASATAMYYAEHTAVPTAGTASTDLGQYMTNIDSILADYAISFGASSVTLTGKNGKVPDTVSASAYFK